MILSFNQIIWNLTYLIYLPPDYCIEINGFNNTSETIIKKILEKYNLSEGENYFYFTRCIKGEGCKFESKEYLKNYRISFKEYFLVKSKNESIGEKEKSESKDLYNFFKNDDNFIL